MPLFSPSNRASLNNSKKKQPYFLAAPYLGDAFKVKTSSFCMQRVLTSQIRRAHDPPELCFILWENMDESAERYIGVLQLNGSQAINGGTFYFPFQKIHASTSLQCYFCYQLPAPSLFQKNPPLCEEILHDLLTRGNWTIIFFFFRADLVLAFLCADPPTTSAVDLKGLLSLLVRDNSVSLVCLLGTVKIMSGDSAAWTTVC